MNPEDEYTVHSMVAPAAAPSSMAYNTAAASVAAPLSVIAYYPFRDFAKMYGQTGGTNLTHFFLSRYKGMATAPEIPLLVSLPYTTTLLSYIAVDRATGSAVLPSAVCGFAGAATKQFTRAYSQNIGKKRNRFHGPFLYQNPIECISGVTRERGVAYWFRGTLPIGIVNGLFFGAAMRSVKWQITKRQRSFFEDIFIVARTMTFWGVFTMPLRNAANQIVRNQTVVEGQFSKLQFGAEFFKNEGKMLLSSAQMMHHMGMSEGVRPLFRGSLMMIFKTNIPFAVFFATYRMMGGAF